MQAVGRLAPQPRRCEARSPAPGIWRPRSRASGLFALLVLFVACGCGGRSHLLDVTRGEAGVGTSGHDAVEPPDAAVVTDAVEAPDAGSALPPPDARADTDAELDLQIPDAPASDRDGTGDPRAEVSPDHPNDVPTPPDGAVDQPADARRDGRSENAPDLPRVSDLRTSHDATDTPPAPRVLALVAGGLGGTGDLDGIGPAARFRSPIALTADGAGNLFVADSSAHTIRKIDLAARAVSTLAGSPGQGGSANGMGTMARFSAPMGIASDRAGRLFVSDSGNQAVRAVDLATGRVTTLAGLPGNAGSQDGLGAAARFGCPRGIVSDAAGHLFVSDPCNYTIRKIVVATGEVTTLAGSAGWSGYGDGVGVDARFETPDGLALDDAGNLLVADLGNCVIRKIDLATGEVSTLAGAPRENGTVDGSGSAVRFAGPYGLANDGAGNLFISDPGPRLRKLVLATGEVTTVASPLAYDGGVEDPENSAELGGLTGLASDGAGNVFLAVSQGFSIRQLVTATGTTSTVAGRDQTWGAADGVRSDASFQGPTGIAGDGLGNLFVADTFNHALRKIVLATGQVTTFAGAPGASGRDDGVAAAARFNQPAGLVSDGLGHLYLSDLANGLIRKVDLATATVSTLAGSSSGSQDGVGGNASFQFLGGLAIDDLGNLFVADGHAVRKIAVDSATVTTLAGSVQPGTADGVGSAARFTHTSALAADHAGNLFVADSGAHTIRKIVIATARVSTFAGRAGESGTSDGIQLNARFNGPTGIVFDGEGALYVSDAGSFTIRKIDISTATVTTVVGVPGTSGVLLGPLPGCLGSPQGLAFGPDGELLIADQAASAILCAWL